MKMHLKIAVVLLATLAVLALGLTGCAEKPEEVAEEAPKEALLGEGMVIYFQCGGPAGGPATIARTNGARDAAKAFGVKLIEQ